MTNVFDKFIAKMVKKHGKANIQKFVDLAHKIYSGGTYRKIHREMCDYAKLVLPKTAKKYKFKFKCDRSLGFYGSDSPESLINFVTKNAGRQHYDAVLMNGDFIGHDRAPEIHHFDGKVTAKIKKDVWTAFEKNKKLMVKTFKIVRKNLP